MNEFDRASTLLQMAFTSVLLIEPLVAQADHSVVNMLVYGCVSPQNKGNSL